MVSSSAVSSRSTGAASLAVTCTLSPVTFPLRVDTPALAVYLAHLPPQTSALQTRYAVLLGAHVSTAGGCRNAPGRAAEIGAIAIQVFTKQPNRWAEVQIPDDERVAFRVGLAEHGVA